MAVCPALSSLGCTSLWIIIECALLSQERALKLRKWAGKMQLYEPEVALLESVVRLQRRVHVSDVCLGLCIYLSAPIFPRAQIESRAGLLNQDTGKPLHAVKHIDVPFAISLLEHYAGWADGKIYGETVIPAASV